MDLQTFASQTRKLNTPISNNKDKKAVNQLLPKQQKTRAYKSVETAPEKIQFDMIKSRFGEMRGKWIMRYLPRVPIDVDRKNITKKQIQEFAQEFAQVRSNRGDEKYIKIEKANLSWIEYSFDVDQWIADNFRGKIPKYKPPISLKWRYRQDWPRFIYVNAPFHDFRDFVAKKFKEFMKKNERKLKHRKFQFLEKVTADLFEYKIDFQSQYIIASLKYSVILGSLAAYTLFFYNKEIDDKKEKNLKKKINRYSDIKKLDRYVRRL